MAVLLQDLASSPFDAGAAPVSASPFDTVDAGRFCFAVLVPSPVDDTTTTTNTNMFSLACPLPSSTTTTNTHMLSVLLFAVSLWPGQSWSFLFCVHSCRPTSGCCFQRLFLLFSFIFSKEGDASLRFFGRSKARPPPPPPHQHVLLLRDAVYPTKISNNGRTSRKAPVLTPSLVTFFLTKKDSHEKKDVTLQRTSRKRKSRKAPFS